MRSRLAKVLLLVLCTLPALSFDARTPGRSAVASFYFACPEYRIPARVRSKAYAKEQLPPRTAYWNIREFEPETPPKRAFKVVGEVEVLARGRSTTLSDLHEKAKEAAEKMGGDVLVDVTWRDAGATKPRIGERGNFVLTAKVARWQQGGTGTIVGE